VELLVSGHEHAGSALEKPALEEVTLTMPPRESLVGRQFGPYRILAPLGAGGMGEVYRAHDDKLGRDVAIKTLPVEFARDPERLARFRREARALASLNHPNIAAIYGIEESGGVDLLILELVEGETLHGPLPVQGACRVAKQIAEGLEAAHGKGIVHRDLKPANVKITPERRVKVLDFGLAKAVWGPAENPHPSQAPPPEKLETLAGHIMGTPGYMSPEQARGEPVDRRADIWAFGCVLYELLADKRAFKGETSAETITAVLQQEPDWRALPAKTPAKIRELLRHCLQKDPNRRLNNISDARKILEDALGGRSRRLLAAAAAAALAVIAVGATVWLRNPVRPTDQSQWTQLTRFSDSVSQPALSPDGKMVAFIRGESTFFGPGQVYVKILPGGEPVQLTHDDLAKMSPVFSPDGTHIAYTTVNQDFKWDTWTVPVLGGEPRMMLKNASGLVWTGPRRIMFSEIRMGVHMAVVASDENRVGRHDVYVPPDEPDMAHRSYLSPDGKSVLLVEMDIDHLWEPCRVVPADGSSPGHKVGPPRGGCTFASWSPDGKWMYFTSNAVGANHIWRQRFPDGKPEQITSGPTEEEGIATAPDGRSFVTAVALQNSSLWVHDGQSERQISLEGNAGNPVFTPDGAKILYRVVKEPPSEFAFFRDPGEVMIADLKSGHSEPLTPGFQILNFDISWDGRQIAMEAPDNAGKARIWLAPLDRSSPPLQIPKVEGGSPHFAPDGDILFRHNEGSATAAGSLGFIYRVRPDGSGLRKVLDYPINQFNTGVGVVSPDGRWIAAWAPLPGDGPAAFQVFSLDGKPPISLLSGEGVSWAARGVLIATVTSHAFFFPLAPGQVLPPMPKGGLHSDDELARIPRARRIEGRLITLGPTPDIYAFYRGSTQRNLYRIPVP
jgi:serine/threonine protein kinase